MITMVVMPWGRVGSNMLNSILSQNDLAKIYNEPLTGIESKCKIHRGETDADIISSEQIAWLDELLLKDRTEKATIINHSAISTGSPSKLSEWIRKNSVQLVSLDRHDDAAVALSIARAEVWIKEGHEVGEKRNWSINKATIFKPEIDCDDLATKIKLVKAGREIMKDIILDMDCLQLYYEDLISDTKNVVSAICTTARIPFKDYVIKTSKFGGTQLDDLVTNPDQVRTTIRSLFPLSDLL